jgi:predicted metal-dependent hydrolase
LDEIIIDQIIRTRRKTLALLVTREGRLVVRAPLRTPLREIHRIVEEKAAWVRRKQAEAARVAAMRKGKQYREGETFLFLGQSYRLRIVEALSEDLHLDGDFLLRRAALPRAREVFLAWYRQQARRVVGAQVEALARANGLTYSRLRITSARTRWGSCSSRGNGPCALNFTWRLALAPLPAIDYVAAHELAHLRVKGHTREFWAEVARILPGYQAGKQWLKDNGESLIL